MDADKYVAGQWDQLSVKTQMIQVTVCLTDNILLRISEAEPGMTESLNEDGICDCWWHHLERMGLA